MAKRAAALKVNAGAPRRAANPPSSAPADGGAPPLDPAMAALGELICRLNPYTRLPEDQTSGLSSGDMQVGMLPAAASGYVANDPDATIACMGIEVERNYRPTWNFKGQDQSVTAAARIPYRFEVKKNGKRIYWQTEYLLIGFVGGGGIGVAWVKQGCSTPSASDLTQSD